MALSINTSVSPAQKNLNANSSLATNMERLSSGLKINSAKDDPAGLVIANRLTSSVKGLNVTEKNQKDGISLTSDTVNNFATPNLKGLLSNLPVNDRELDVTRSEVLKGVEKVESYVAHDFAVLHDANSVLSLIGVHDVVDNGIF